MATRIFHDVLKVSAAILPRQLQDARFFVIGEQAQKKDLKKIFRSFFITWYTRQDSNLRHPGSKPGALSS